MTRKTQWLLALVATLCMATIVYAQSTSGSPVQITGRQDVATKVADCNSAVNNTCTATLTPSGANYAYITGMDLAVCGDATGTVQTNVTWTSTGLGGTPIIWAYSTAINPGACTYKEISYATPVKSLTPGAAVTVVSPAVALHTAYNANIFWYEGQ